MPPLDAALLGGHPAGETRISEGDLLQLVGPLGAGGGHEALRHGIGLLARENDLRSGHSVLNGLHRDVADERTDVELGIGIALFAEDDGLDPLSGLTRDSGIERRRDVDGRVGTAVVG